MERNFCYLCGGKLIEKNGETKHWQCSKCKQIFYVTPKPCVEALLVNSKKEVLILRRGEEPGKGKYDVPGGFVDPGELLEEALKRELKEELGLSHEDYSRPDYLASYADTYEWGKEVHPVIVARFTAHLNTDLIKPNHEVSEYHFVSLNTVDKYDFAWLAHRNTIIALLQSL